MTNNKQSTSSSANPSNNDHNSIMAIEHVYPAESIDSAECINNLSTQSHEAPFNPQQVAANDTFSSADIYSLESARMAKHNRALERRSSKSQLTDRRSPARLHAHGEIQKDRRADNRAANIESIRLSNSDTQPPVEHQWLNGMCLLLLFAARNSDLWLNLQISTNGQSKYPNF